MLGDMESALIELEERPDDGELVARAFRALHTIKGSGAMFGFEAVAAFTHHVETAFDQVRKGSMAVTHELIAIALSARDHMRLLIEQPNATDQAGGAAILAALQQLFVAPAGPASTPLAPDAPSGSANWRIRIRLPRDAMANGTNPLALLDELRALGTASVTALTDDVPPLEALDPTALLIGWDVVLSTTQPRTAIEDVFLFVRDEMTLQIERLEADASERRLGEILTSLDYVEPDAVQAALAEQQDSFRLQPVLSVMEE